MNDLYENELAELKSASKYGVGLAVVGDSGVGKTLEILRVLSGIGCAINTVSTNEEDITVNTYSIKSLIPFEGFEAAPIVAYKGKKEAEIAVKDLAGQYNTVLNGKITYTEKHEGNKKIVVSTGKSSIGSIINEMMAKNAKIIEMVADTTRVGTIASLEENWLEMTGSDKYFCVYLSKTRVADSYVNMDDVINGDLSSIKNLPGLETLLAKTNKPLVFCGDMDTEGHGAEVYLLKAGFEKDGKIVYDWLDLPVKVNINGPKALPVIRYLINNDLLTPGSKQLVQEAETAYGIKMGGY